MAESRKGAAAPSTEVRFKIPPELLEVFAKQPRVVIRHRPDGLWPIDPGMLVEIEWAKLARSKDFAKNFEVLIMPKA